MMHFFKIALAAFILGFGLSAAMGQVELDCGGEGQSPCGVDPCDPVLGPNPDCDTDPGGGSEGCRPPVPGCPNYVEPPPICPDCDDEASFCNSLVDSIVEQCGKDACEFPAWGWWSEDCVAQGRSECEAEHFSERDQCTLEYTQCLTGCLGR